MVMTSVTPLNSTPEHTTIQCIIPHHTVLQPGLLLPGLMPLPATTHPSTQTPPLLDLVLLNPGQFLVSGCSVLLLQMDTQELDLQGTVKEKAEDPVPSLVFAKGHLSQP